MLSISLSKRKHFVWRFYLKILQLSRKILIHLLKDPIISYNLDGSKILLPLSHDLPIIRMRYPHYSTSLSRIASVVKEKYPDLSLIDIGANVGDTVAIVRHNTHFPILCIDGDKHFFSILLENIKNWSDVKCVNSFVGDTTRTFAGKNEVSGGTGHLTEDFHSNQLLEIKKLSKILDDNPRFANSKIIKVDTDGFDCKILKSELELLGSLKPILFFEYDPYFFGKFKDDGFQVFHSLKGIGYAMALIFENTGEYLAHVNLNNELLLEDIHQFYSGWAGQRYCDICVFHTDDLDIFTQVRSGEIKFSETIRFHEYSL
jgi:FkbM family methyltransferase